MGELLASAAAALGLPEDLVTRSAEARAAVTGGSVDEVLAAWAGGESVASPPGEAPAEEQEQVVPESPPGEVPLEEQEQVLPESPAEEAPSAAEPVIAVPIVPRPEPVPPPARVAPGEPPVLVGASDRPMTTFIGVIGLFLVVLLVGFVGPAATVDEPGARSSEIAHSDAGAAGQAVYEKVGCAACHTQMVRPVVADVGLGAVSLNDSNQVLGTRRFGPDLSDVGSRLSGSQIESIVTGFGGHLTMPLSDQDLGNLVTYLLESSSSGEAGE